MSRVTTIVIALLLFCGAPAIAQVSVTITEVASGKEYVVMNGRLANGELAYMDRTYLFQSVPLELIGATYIQTSNSDKNWSGAVFLSFNISEDSAVFVSHDVRVTNKPSWLSDFVDTGLDLVTNDTAFNVYKKDFSTGLVVLGGNSCGSGGCSMYSVAVVSSDLPLGPPAGSTLIGVTWTPVHTVSVELEWDASESENDPGIEVDGYRVFYRKAGEDYDYNVPVCEGANTTCILEGLPDVDLYFVVRAFNSDGESGNSNEVLYDGAG